MRGEVPAAPVGLPDPVAAGPEGRDLPHALDPIDHERGQVAETRPHLVAQPLRRALRVERAQGGHHQERREHDGQRPRHERQDAQHHGRHEERDHRGSNHVSEKVLDRLDVAAHDADEVAGLAPHQVRGRERLQRLVHVDPHLGQQPERQVVRRPRLAPARQRAQRRQHRQRQQVRHEVASPEHLDHQQRARRAQRDSRRVVQQPERQAQGELGPPSAYESEQPPPDLHRADVPGPGVLGGDIGRGRPEQSAARRRFRLRRWQRRGQQVGRRGGLLAGHERRVGAARRGKLRVAARLHQPAPVQHQDAVGGDDARQPVGDYQRRLADHQPLERLLDRRLVLRVDAGQRLVEQQYRRRLQQRPGDGKPLALSAGEPDAALPDPRVVPVRQLGDVLVGVRRARGLLHLGRRRVRLAEAQIVGDRPLEDVRVLGHDRELPAERVQRQVPDVVSAQRDAARLWVVEAQQQPDERRLAGAARADHPKHLARVQGEADVLQRGPAPALVGEVDALEPHLGRDLAVGRVGGLLRVSDLHRGVQQREYALRGRHRRHALVIERDKLPQRPEHLPAQHQDDQQRLELHQPVVDAYPAPHQRDRRARRDAQDRGRPGQAVGGEHLHRRPEQRPRAHRQKLAAALRLTEGLQRRQPLHAVQEVGPKVAVRLAPGLVPAAVQLLDHGRQEQRHQREHDEHQPDADVEHRHEHEDQHRSRGRDDELRQILPEKDLQALHAVHDGRQHVAGAPLVEVARPQRQRVLVQPPAQKYLGLRRRPVAHGVPDVLERAAQQYQRPDDHQRRDHRRKILALEEARDHHARDRQPGYAYAYRDQPDEGGEKDRRPQALGHPPQSKVEVHVISLGTSGSWRA